MRKLTTEEKLWNFLLKKMGKRRSADAKKVYHYVIKAFTTKPKEVKIKYLVDTAQLTKAFKLATKTAKKIRAIHNRG